MLGCVSLVHLTEGAGGEGSSRSNLSHGVTLGSEAILGDSWLLAQLGLLGNLIGGHPGEHTG